LKARSAYLAGFVLLVIVALDVTKVVLVFAVDWRRVPAALQPTSSVVPGSITVLILGAVAALIAIRRPENPIGWLMLGAGIFGGLIDLTTNYAGFAVYMHPGLPGGYWVYWVGQSIWLLLFDLLLVLIPMFFPDGRLLSRRWLIPIGLTGALSLLWIAATLDPAATAPLPNPAGIRAFSGLNRAFSSPVLGLIFFLVLGSGVASLVVRYRRGSEQQRQQLKWLMVAAAFLLVALVSQGFIPALQALPLTPIAAGLLPVAIGIAVLRYRLYDIDLIINKALVYGGLAAIITATYVLVVVGIGAFVGNSRQFLLSIVTTAIIALAFQPLRQRAQRLANRLVYGKRATPYETLSQFSEHLSETFSEEDILDRMSRMLAQGTGAERAEVWVRTGNRLLLASSSPALNGSAPSEMRMDNGTLPPMERDRVAPVTHQGELLGALAVIKKRGEAVNDVEQKLVNDLAGQAGLVLKNLGLNRELLARLDDLRASRQRLVAAQDDERRRIERNLHDGAQQHLVALKVKLGLAEMAAEPTSKVRGMITQLKADADEALTTMRELARGIYPPLLASDGLPAALRAQARRMTIPIDLDLADVPRQPREVEAAIYFCCLEALQNVSKYADATRVRLRLWSEASRLAFRVEDNGRGFDPSQVTTASGIQNMRDRLETLGGSLEVRSEPGKGTSVEGTLPIA
jgi:signal transduction histidine kinase